MEKICTILSTIIGVLSIVIGLLSPKIYEVIRNRKLKKYNYEGYNSIICKYSIFNIVIIPLIYIIINAYLLVKTSKVELSDYPTYIGASIFIMEILSIYNLINLDKKINIIKSIDKKHYGRFNKSWKVNYFINKFFSIIIYVLTLFICILSYAKKVVLIDYYILIILFYVLSILIYYISGIMLFKDKINIIATLYVTIDYQTFYNCYMRIKIKDNNIFQEQGDSIKIYSTDDNTLFLIDKARIYNIKTIYKADLKDRYKNIITQKSSYI